MKSVFAIILAFLSLTSVFSQEPLPKDSIQDSINVPFFIDIDELANVFGEGMVSVKPSFRECPFNIPNAIEDIKNDSLSIVIHGGILGFGDIDECRAEAFMKKYNVDFYYLGCLIGWDRKTADTYGYNEKIFEYLVETHGEIVNKEFKAIRNREENNHE